MPEVFTHSEPLVEVGPDWLTRLKTAAEESPLRRARLCLHVTPNDTVQEMIERMLSGFSANTIRAKQTRHVHPSAKLTICLAT